MPALRTIRVRTRLSNPQEPPPGMTPVTYGDGLTLDGSVLEADFGTGHTEVARGDAVGVGTVAADDITDAGTFGKELLRQPTDTDARSELGLGAAALLNVGTSAGTVAAGDDARIDGAVQESIATTDGDMLVRVAGALARLATTTAGRALLTAADAATQLALVEAPRTTTPTLASSTGWTLTPVGSCTITISGGAMTFSIPSGSTNEYNLANYPWPTTTLGVRMQFNIQITTADINDSTTVRVLMKWGAYAHYIQLAFTSSGKVRYLTHVGGAPTDLHTGVSLATRVWFRVESIGTGVRVWTCITNNTDDATLCAWTCKLDTTYSEMAGTGSGGLGVPDAFEVYAVSESHASTATITGRVAAITLQQLNP